MRRLYPRLRNPITSFTGKHDFLALDYPASIVFKGKTYPSVAAVMRAEKARLGDAEYRANLKEIVGLALHYKFTEHEELQERLLDTGEDDIVTTPAIVGELLTLLRYHLAAEDGDEEDDEEEEEAPPPRTARTSTRRSAAPAAAPAGAARKTWRTDPVLREKMERLEANAARIPALRVLWPDHMQPVPFRVGRKTALTLNEAFALVTPRGKKKRREWLADGTAERSLRYFVTLLARRQDFRDALLKTKKFPLVFRTDIDAGGKTYADILMDERERITLEEGGRERLADTTAMQPGRQRVEGEDVVERLRGLGFRIDDVAPQPSSRPALRSARVVLGFTGTREGMTTRQKATVRRLMREMNPTSFVHGDCVGADAEAHEIATSLGVPVTLRPCNLSSQRARVQGAVTEHPAEAPLDRNRKIVDQSTHMIATPKSATEEQRGGTWYTIRYARRSGKPITIVYPDGSVG